MHQATRTHSHPGTTTHRRVLPSSRGRLWACQHAGGKVARRSGGRSGAGLDRETRDVKSSAGAQQGPTSSPRMRESRCSATEIRAKWRGQPKRGECSPRIACPSGSIRGGSWPTFAAAAARVLSPEVNLHRALLPTASPRGAACTRALEQCTRRWVGRRRSNSTTAPRAQSCPLECWGVVPATCRQIVPSLPARSQRPPRRARLAPSPPSQTASAPRA